MTVRLTGLGEVAVESAAGPRRDRRDDRYRRTRHCTPNVATPSELVGRGAHYLLTVKANQPTLLNELRGLPRDQVPSADQTSGKGQGRIECRTVMITSVRTGLGFPHAHLALQVTRRRRRPAERRWQTADRDRHALTDLT